MKQLWLVTLKEARVMPDLREGFKTMNSMDTRIREHPLKSSGKVLK